MFRKNVSWKEVDEYINSLVTKVPRGVCGVYGIPRGGLILAAILSHKLDVPMLQAPCKGCVVIDDIADTGTTLKHYADCGYYITTMFYHKQSIVVPNYWFFAKDKSWIVYPWEDR